MKLFTRIGDASDLDAILCAQESCQTDTGGHEKERKAQTTVLRKCGMIFRNKMCHGRTTNADR